MLEASNYELISSGTVEEAIKRIATDSPDVVVLDLGLPDGDGRDVIRHVRQWSDVPIIVLSARDREAEKIEVLDLGADDFVNKPFGVGELLARIRTALRHRMERVAETPVLRTSDIKIDNVRHCVTRADVQIKLTPKEFELLHYLASNPNVAIPHGKLLQAIWGPDYGNEVEYLHVFMNQIRKKIEPDPSKPYYLITEPRLGYRFCVSSQPPLPKV